MSRAFASPPDFSLLATGDESGKVRLCKTTGPPATWPREPAALLSHGEDQEGGGPPGVHADVNQVDWSRDGAFVFSGGPNRWLKQWDAAAALAGRPVEYMGAHHKRS